MTRLLNALGYQITWFAAVIGAGRGWAWAGPLTLLVFAGWQLGTSRFRAADLRLVGVALICGLLIDGALVQGHMARFAAPSPSSEFAPVWILSLWCAFALTLNHSLDVLKSHGLWISSLLGAVAAPLAYLGASRGWDAIEFTDSPWPAMLTLAMAWSLAMPFLVHAARRWTATPHDRLWRPRRRPA
ncbi:MAG: DUF2878 domain-containing protein [Tahibacter sp.]